MSIKTLFTDIAAAIKEKNTDIVTVTPAGMPQAIRDIPSGGGGDFSFIETLHYDMKRGYVASNEFFYDPGDTTYCDVYEILTNHIYFLALGNTRGNRFRAITASVDPYTVTTNVSGMSVISVDSPSFDNSYVRFISNLDGFLIIGKTNATVAGIKTYLIDSTNWS